jgi:hypothetical protein
MRSDITVLFSIRQRGPVRARHMAIRRFGFNHSRRYFLPVRYRRQTGRPTISGTIKGTLKASAESLPVIVREAVIAR